MWHTHERNALRYLQSEGWGDQLSTGLDDIAQAYRLGAGFRNEIGCVLQRWEHRKIESKRLLGQVRFAQKYYLINAVLDRTDEHRILTAFHEVGHIVHRHLTNTRPELGLDRKSHGKAWKSISGRLGGSTGACRAVKDVEEWCGLHAAHADRVCAAVCKSCGWRQIAVALKPAFWEGRPCTNIDESVGCTGTLTAVHPPEVVKVDPALVTEAVPF